MHRRLFSRLLPLLPACTALLLGALPCRASIGSFTASPAAFLPGQNVTLSWSVTAGDVLSISNGVGAVSGTTCSVTVLPSALTTYILTDTTSSTNSGANFTVAYRSVFLRKTFTVAGPVPRSILLRVMHNDAAVVWINGLEVGRFGFPPGSPTDPPFNTTAYYERANNPWCEVILLSAGNLLHAGTNIITIQGFAKPPQPRRRVEDLLPSRVVGDFRG